MEGVFVTGTDTGIGKTFVCACLVRFLGARYWKPVQTGAAEEEGDTATVMRLAGLDAARVHAPRHVFAAPLSPEAAARRERAVVSLADFALPTGDGALVVEGAGGVLVPLGGGALMVDLMRVAGLPVVLVARGALGTINHTLLSLEALRRRDLCVLGVIMVGEIFGENASDIAHHGEVAVLELPWLPLVDTNSVERLSSQKQKFFGSFFQKRTAFSS
jgi:malonyl-CoA O-methyltransferase